MSEFELTFGCPNFDCAHRFDFHQALAANNGFPVMICPTCNCLLEVSGGSGSGGEWPFVSYSYRCSVKTLHPRDVEKIPSVLLDIIREAIRCYAATSYYACVAMCRRAVEAITVLKNASGKTLKLKIENLGHRALISERSVYDDQYVRSLGNIACHFDEVTEQQIGSGEARSCLLTLLDVTFDIFLDLPANERKYSHALW